LSGTANSGIQVIESLGSAGTMPVCRESVVAFVGPAPRGPIDIPVEVRSVAEFRRRFGSPHQPSRLESILGQFFENGGTLAMVVRVGPSAGKSRIDVPAGDGVLSLQAANPGPLEYLRASVDYDDIQADDKNHFNLTIHRLNTPEQRLVEEQEIYRGLSVDADDPMFIAQVLESSALVRLCGETPDQRPERTLGTGADVGFSYLYSVVDRNKSRQASDYDLIGSDTQGTGLFAFDQAPVIDLLCLIAGAPGQDLGPVVLFAAERYCRRRSALLLVDPLSHWTTVAQATAALREPGFASPNVVTYFPRLDSEQTGQLGSGRSLLGALAGAMVSGDADDGVGASLSDRQINLRCRQPLGQTLTQSHCMQLVRAGINPVRQASSGHLWLEGLVTLARGGGLAGELNDLRSRRLALFVLGSIMRATRWTVFQANESEMLPSLDRQVRGFLRALFEAGVLQGAQPLDAFYMKCDLLADGMTDDMTSSTSPVVEIVCGLALNDPGRFTAYRIVHEQTDCRVIEQGTHPGLAMAS
jgi:hypothetical protein